MKYNYAGIEDAYCSADFAAIFLQPIIYDGTSTWGKGADKGFSAFLDASENMELYDIETNSEVYRKGVHIREPWTGFNSPEDMFDHVYAGTKDLLNKNKFLTFFGGEHSVSIGVIKSFYEHYEDLTVAQIDAHADLRPSYHGSKYNHACAVYDASRNCNLVQIGIRSMDISEKEFIQNGNCFFDHEIQGSDDWIDRALERMTDKVYITLDLDALNPGIMPATGTPEPGGLSWYTNLKLLAAIFREKEVMGFDIVELAPIANLHGPNFLVAKLYYKMLTYKYYL